MVSASGTRSSASARHISPTPSSVESPYSARNASITVGEDRSRTRSTSSAARATIAAAPPASSPARADQRAHQLGLVGIGQRADRGARVGRGQGLVQHRARYTSLPAAVCNNRIPAPRPCDVPAARCAEPACSRSPRSRSPTPPPRARSRCSAASRSPSPPAGASRSPANRAAARARSSTSSPASTPSTPAASRVAGAEVTALADAARAELRRRAIGLVFQQFNLIPSLDVAANLAFQARLARRLDPAWQAELTSRLGLADLLARYPEQLSGGQQQRVAIGRALAARPGLILADEPTGNLDEATGDAVMALLLDLVAATGASLLLVTHSPRLAALHRRPRHPPRRARWHEPVLAALLGHWRRHPVELATLLVGLAVATALLSGVQALNAEARASYARAAAPPRRRPTLAQIVPAGGPPHRARRLRRPPPRRLEGLARPRRRPPPRRRTASASSASTSSPCPPGTLAADRRRAPPPSSCRPTARSPPPRPPRRLADATDLPPRAGQRRRSPPTPSSSTSPRPPASSPSPTGVSRLLLAPGDAARPLPPDLAQRLAIRPPEPRSDLDRLTDELPPQPHRLRLPLLPRRPLHRLRRHRPRLRAAPPHLPHPARLRRLRPRPRRRPAPRAPRPRASSPASPASPPATPSPPPSSPTSPPASRGLYGARVPGSLSLAPAWWAAGLAISLAGALAAAATSLWRAFTLPLLAPAQPQAWLAAQRRSLRLQLALAAALALAGPRRPRSSAAASPPASP